MRRLAIVLAASLLAPPAAAETASLLFDIRRSEPVDFTEHDVLEPLLPLEDAILFFAKESAGSGEVMWSSDGTLGGTRPLRDLCPGTCSSRVQRVGTLGNVAVLFVESFGQRVPYRLWRSDGTRPGTFPIADRSPDELEPCPGGTGLESAVVEGVLFFKRGRDCALWRTDGTVAGTRRVRELDPDPGFPSFVRGLTAWRGEVWFYAIGSDRGLWRSDGTPAGTVFVRRLSGVPRFLTPAGSRLFFVAPEEDRGEELWVSDGTAAGTRPLTRFLAPGPFNDVPVFFEEIDGILHFLADDVTGGLDLWRSDGTEAGTRRVTAFGNARPFADTFGRQRQIVKLGSRLLFAATDGLTGFRLWSSGGTPQTTAALTGCRGGSCPTLADAALVEVGGKVLFLGSRPGESAAVWSSDGTGSGTRIVRDLCLGHCSADPEGLAAHLNQAYFLAASPGRTFELWRTDGTERGTLRLADLGDFASFPPVAVRGRILFTADGPRSNAQLWASDGTPEGTGPLTWLHGGGSGSEPHDFRSDGVTVWFRAVDGQEERFWRSAGTAATTEKTALAGEHAVLASGFAFFALFEGGFERLARTDGTPGGTLPLTPAEGYLHALVAFGDGVAAVFRMPDDALAFWRSDGSLAGTRRLPDLPAALGFAVQVIPVGPELFFVGNGSVWRSDGTPGDMRQVHLEQRSFQQETLVRLGNRVFFVGRSREGDRRVWKIEGATGSPRLLLPLDSPSGRSPSNLAVFRGALYFLAQTESFETGLWSSDGTAAGTVLLKEISSAPFTSLPPDEVEFVAAGDRLFFPFANQAYGSELWSTDGTPQGTVLVRDIVPGPGSSSPSYLAAAGDRIFFAAAGEEHGIELWQSDGTESGTRLVHDINPGAPSSQPAELTVAGGRLFFAADDGVHGREPWVLPLGAQGCQAAAEALCLGGRFRVEAFWRDFQGGFGPGRAVSLTTDTGYFWFFDPTNVEVILKVLDGQGLNGHRWVFYGALSTVEYTLTVTDVQTGATRRYVNPPGRLGSLADVTAFGPLGATGSASSLGPAAVEHEPITMVRKTAAAPCVPSATRLCLQGGRFAVEADWRDFQGNQGKGRAVPLPGGDTGYFWFFAPGNVEVVLKVLDGRPLTGKFWVFYGALSSVQYTLTVTDTETGKVKKYENPSGRLASVADTGAF